MDRLRSRKTTKKNTQETPTDARRSTELEEIEIEVESAVSPKRGASTAKRTADKPMEERQSAPMDARRREEPQNERNSREEPLELNRRSREPTEKRLSNEELELKIAESEDRVETLLEEMAELLEMDEGTSEEVAKIEKELANLEKRIKTWKRLQEIRKAKEKSNAREETVRETAANEAWKMPDDKWRVPNNLPVFRSAKDTEDPLEFIEKFERVCQANGINFDRYIKLISLCLDATDVQWISQWTRSHGDEGTVWNDFREAFIAHFQHPNAMIVWQSKIRSLKMDNTGVQRYSDQFIRLANRLGWNLEGELAIFHFKSGLPRWLVEQLTTAEVARGGSLSVDILAKMALQLEAIYKQQHQEELCLVKQRKGVDNKPPRRPNGSDREKYKPTLECHRCGKLGHKAMDCYSKVPRETFTKKPDETTKKPNTVP